MAIKQNATVQGVEINKLRAGAYTSGEIFDDLAGDLSALYEQTVGEKVPDSTTIAATAHTHDGTNGALIRIPLAQWSLGALLHARVAAPTAGVFGWAGLHRGIFPVPPGVTEVAVLVIGSPGIGESLRFSTIDETQTVLQGPVRAAPVLEGSYLSPNRADLGAAVVRMDVTASEWCQLFVEAWDARPGSPTGDHNSGDLPAPNFRTPREIYSIIVLPIVQAPIAVAANLEVDLANDSDVTMVSAFPSIDESLVGDDQPIDSFILQRMAQALGLCYELVTDKPWGNRSTATVRGHNHGEDSSGSLEDRGADIMHALGAWSYGALRTPHSSVAAGLAGYVGSDCTDPGTNESSLWHGQIVAANYYDSGGTHTGAEKVAIHRFRMPFATTANAITAGTSKVEAAALVWDDGAGSVDFRVGDSGQTTWGSSATVALTGAAALRLVKVQIGVQAVEAEQSFEVSANLSTYKTEGLAICSVGLAYWP